MPSDGAFKTLLFKIPFALKAVRLGKAVRYRLLPPAGDADFASLSLLDRGEGVALDVGANNGQSAAAILRRKPGFRVVSIEPNPACAPTLNTVQRLFGARMKVIHAGASDRAGTLRFYVPVRSGRQLLEEGTFVRESLGTPASVARIGREGADYTLDQIERPVVTVDSLGLDPAFVKVDVQGHELAVVSGMMETIGRTQPLIMLENNPEEEAIAALLAPLGYAKRYWQGGRFGAEQAEGSVNFFMVPPPLAG